MLIFNICQALTFVLIMNFLLQAKRHENFLQWVEQLKKHRLYRQHVLTFGNVRHVQGRILKDMTKPMKDTTRKFDFV